MIQQVTQSGPEPRQEEAAQWAGPFLRSLLDCWREASATDNDIFHPNLDRQWQKTEGDARTLVSQCRLIYNFCRGYLAFGDSHYADAAATGLQGLARFFKRPEGGYNWSVSADGTCLDDTPNSYGHAFCILALAAAAEALNDSALSAQALATWRYVHETFGDPYGGIVWHAGDTGVSSRARSQNPLMHLFEALMALSAVDLTGESRQAAEHMLSFVEGLAGFRQGRLIEAYSSDWTPLPLEEGGVVNIGHQFEWAFLLSEWSKLTGDSDALHTGRVFVDTTLRWGLDGDGGVWEACDTHSGVLATHKGLWQQCEAIRALHRYARHHQQSEADHWAQRALEFYRNNFVDEQYGGVYAMIAQGQEPAHRHKGDLWKLDYHTLGMCLELL